MSHWFDTHIHLLAPEWQQSTDELHRQALSAGIEGLLIPGVKAVEWPQLLELTNRFSGVYAAPGLHPVYAEQWSDDSASQLIRLSQENSVVAIGEIGLDGAFGPSLEKQEVVFRAQLQIALDAGLPVLLHCRKATGQVLAILRELTIGEKVGGVWHGFSGSVEVAQELVDLGFVIGVGPVLLRESARKLPEAVLELPPESLVLETDAPDMIENPEGVITVAEKLAELRDWTPEKTRQITTDNARRILKL